MEQEQQKYSGCLLCGKTIDYSQTYVEMDCIYCGKKLNSNVACADGHFVCDSCHEASGNDLIESYCATTQLKNPIQMANMLLVNPAIKLHGPEHHFLVPAVLLASYCNTEKGLSKSKKRWISSARTRAEMIPGGSCGSHGNCGAGVGAGIFTSIITRSTPMSVNGFRYANLATANALYTIANHGGPRCCKRDSYLAIRETARFLHEHFSIRLYDYSSDISCKFSSLNKECLDEECPFFSSQAS